MTGHKADFNIANHGSVFIVTPLTPEAEQWMDENVSYESWQMWGSGIAVDHHYIGNLVDGILCEGFEVN